MTPPELLVDAWLSAQDSFHASKALEKQHCPAKPAVQEEKQPPSKQARRLEEFWQEWFGFWR
ncbi:MAG: hypothetical protein R2748_23485 [Bryobacterales bacterium]